MLIEKHYIPGGLCSSFSKNGFYFDAGAHFLGSCRPNGQIGRLLADLSLGDRLQLIRCEPSDVVISKDHETFIYSDESKLAHSLALSFPDEETAIHKFLTYIRTPDALQLYVELNELTFKELLDRYFSNWELKSVLSTLLGNIGLPSSRASALTSTFLFREFVLDGGYYPRGGMQSFPNILLQRFHEYGGTSLMLTSATKVYTDQSGTIDRVRIKIGGRQEVEIAAKVVVANCDPYQVYRHLLEDQSLRAKWESENEARMSSVSAFMVHLGIEHDIGKETKYRCNLWSYRRGHIDDYYEGVIRGDVDRGRDSFVFCSIPSLHDTSLLPAGRHSAQLIIAAPYADRKEWAVRREELAEDVIDRVEQYIPGLSRWIKVKQIATPPTIVKYTWNHRGSMYGWASTPEQVGRRRFPQTSDIGGLFFSGHWTGVPSGYSGVPTVVTSGRSAARLAMRYLGQMGHNGVIIGANVNGHVKDGQRKSIGKAT